VAADAEGNPDLSMAEDDLAEEGDEALGDEAGDADDAASGAADDSDESAQKPEE
jgi:hypothetical protein